ncbi:MAG: UDP-N-acetylmuramoyl-tripeptide--D-alanyl-D-alanine ligase [Flavobacteriales bacterium]|nr:MAG: UDP-N-acetylmuramoyl-tripeptide--D-alanyl-D-alanine ligase [Flavobacteriales bacterium]
MDIPTLYTLFKKHPHIITDTRKMVQNGLFFALKGDNFNGNTFAKEALKKGASYAVVDETADADDTKIILVEDVLSTLQQLAAYHRNQLGLPILAITGSNGKTTTKELINAVLSQKYNTVATKGNLNNHIGVPLTLLSMDTTTEFGIVEMGANHLGEIAFLSQIAQPDYGYITNFGKAHLEGFGSLEGVVKGKTELYRYLKAHGKTVFVNDAIPKQMAVSKGINRITFGGQQTEIPVVLHTVSPFVSVMYKGLEMNSWLIGSYNFNNIAAAIAIGHYFKVNAKNIKTAIENYTPQNSRSQLINTSHNQLILDAYNANPTSMLAALENLAGLKVEKKIAILGDMFELGDSALEEHQRIVDVCQEVEIDKVFIIGELFNQCLVLSEKIEKYSSFEKAIEVFESLKNAGATILIKGSRGMALERVTKYL